MALMKTSNPALNVNSFRVDQAVSGEAMTLAGTVNKTGILLICVVATAAWSWSRFFRASTSDAALPLGIGLVGGFVVAMVTIFKKEWSPITAPLYALLEGLALGGISSTLDRMYHGIAIQAVALTFGTMAVMLLAYTSGLIRATRKFTIGVVAATGAIFLVYLADMVMGLFGSHVPLINSTGPVGIAIS